MLRELIFERGIGEMRAALIEDGRIVELHLERGHGLRAASVCKARLTRILVPGHRGIVAIGTEEALIEPLPRGLTEGATLFVEVVREAIPEAGRPRLPKVVASAATAESAAPLLVERLGLGRELHPHQPDSLESAGWSDVLEEARSGVISFEGGTLAVAVTPAMTLIDIDGAGPALDLALAGAAAAAAAIRRHGIGGSIGIDFPTCRDKAERQQIAAIIDGMLPQPFERTAVNGFGFLQIVRRRARPSNFELIQGAPAESAALALLRQAERAVGAGVRTLCASPAVAAWLEARTDLIAELARRTGVHIQLKSDSSLATGAGYVHHMIR